LFDFIAGKYGFHNSGGILSDFIRPLTEAFAVPLHVLLMIRRHMGFLCAVLTAPTIKTDMGAQAYSVK
jgi:hypothetical protein